MKRRPFFSRLAPPPAPPSSINVASFLAKRAPLFHGTDPKLLARLASRACVRRYVQGQFVCHAGEPAREVWTLLEGRVCVNRCSWKGGRVNIEIMVPGDVFGLPALSHWSYPSDIQATRESLVAAIPGKVILDEMIRHPKLAQSIVSAVSERLSFVQTQLLLSRESVECRLAAALLYLCHKFGKTLPLTSAEIGEMAQTTPETAMRKLKLFETAGLLKRSRGRVVVSDQRGLEARLAAPGKERRSGL
jgi:CRP-like cAMP-binding protein